MVKAVSLLITLGMIIQLVRPLGLPGLHKRADAWKLAAAALVAFTMVALTKGE